MNADPDIIRCPSCTWARDARARALHEVIEYRDSLLGHRIREHGFGAHRSLVSRALDAAYAFWQEWHRP